MIKFFRKIRQRMLTENQFTKYLLYALGEIILVVIGILLALQINNWNEHRKEETSKKKLMLNIRAELMENKLRMEHHILGLHTSNAILNKVLQFSTGSLHIPMDSLKLYLNDMQHNGELAILTSVQEEAISSGKFVMLSDTVKQNLSILKDYMESRNAIQDRGSLLYTNDIDNKFDKLWAKLGLVFELPEQLKTLPSIPIHPDFKLSDDEIAALVKDSETYMDLYRVYQNQHSDEIWVKFGLETITNRTIDLINKELKEN
ncbi:DUF6090 family protein [Flagellimonas zhangzhouensis]|uniref:Uncharacterized protein n=1 Tax=Flagellimonas zhangzhouensis TaxID=1073328 RepID=A0A1H2SGD4_9FLAO|nr:DUF6090 family protein [Allomuricauda zhangzhouensis]SDQ73949.1 hypothetical protein SAMN05216294_2416 [Allomuricauda zhangzhouensis]SDW30079.1 hypothetical protein SAMN04487892_1062 [Allomuricauda zhangzhouensis]